MTVCKYYLQGNCKFGNNCHYDHPPRGASGGGGGYSNYGYQSNYNHQQASYQSNQYRYSSNNQQNYSQQSRQSTNQKNQPTDVNDFSDQDFFLLLRDHIRKELSDWLNSTAWKLSVYSYSKSAPQIPFFEDISPEEVRFSLYEAKKNNNFNNAYQQYLAKVNQTNETIKQLLNQNQQTNEYLLNYFHESQRLAKNQNGSQASGTTTSQTSASNPFLKIVQQKQQLQQQQQQQTMFQTPQVFGQTQQPTGFFQKPTPAPVSSLSNPFTQFATNAFSQPQAQFGSLQTGGAPLQQQSPLFNLGNKQMPMQNSQPMNTNSTGPTNFFSQVVNMSTNSTPSKENTFFGKPLPPASSTLQGNNPNYSNLNDISKQNLEEFKASQFTLGKIPYNPPPRELC